MGFQNFGNGGHNTPKGGFVLTKRLVIPYKKRTIHFPSPSRQITQLAAR
jgi:hypothetical protein